MKKIITAVLVLIFAIPYANSQELAWVKEKRKIGYIDLSGSYVIEPQFKHAGSFSGKYAAAAEGRDWGYIDAKGEWVIEPQYKRAYAFNSGYAKVEKDGRTYYIDSKNKELKTPEADKIYDFNKHGAALLKVNNKVGIINTKGQFVLKPTFDLIKDFDGAYARFEDDGKWGIVNSKGKIVIPGKYDGIGKYSKNGVWAQEGDTWGVIKNGKFIALPDAEKIWHFGDGSSLTYARKNGKMGFINGAGKWIIKPTYEKARAFNNGLAPVSIDGKWGYINEKGEKVIDFKYDDAEIFASNGLAPVKDGDWGFVNKKGELVIPTDYKITTGTGGLAGLFSDDIEKGFQESGLSRVYYKRRWHFINAKGEFVGKEYKDARIFVDTSK